MKVGDLSFESLAMLTFCCQIESITDIIIDSQEWNMLEKKVKNCGFKNVSALLSATEDDLILLLSVDEGIVSRMMKRLQLLPKIIAYLARLERKGIYTLTKYDKSYPTCLLAMKKRAPLYFFVSGETRNLSEGISFAGKKILTADTISTVKAVYQKISAEGFDYIANDSKGLDVFAMRYILERGGRVVCLISDGMLEKISEYRYYIKNGQLTILCHTGVEAKFSITNTLEKNTFVCGMSKYHVIIESVLNAGETWFTALQNMHYQWANTLVYANETTSNARLIDMGGVPFSKQNIETDISLDELYASNKVTADAQIVNIDQLSIFDFLGE